MIFLVEDDNSIRELIIYTLNQSGYEAQGFETPSEFWKAIQEQIPELIMLDIMLPQEDGITILKKLRNNADTQYLPIMMLTAKGSEYDRVMGLDSGADDYVTKPFGMMELLAHIRALLRRAKQQEHRSEYLIGELYCCPSKHIVRVKGEDIVLTRKEFEMLKLLIENMDVVYTRDQLLNRIWGYSFDGESRTVDVHIRTLRQKLGPHGDYIHTVRGIGYKIGEDHDREGIGQ